MVRGFNNHSPTEGSTGADPCLSGGHGWEGKAQTNGKQGKLNVFLQNAKKMTAIIKTTTAF